jgi:nucleotide-binding universal stress UspA family protein
MSRDTVFTNVVVGVDNREGGHDAIVLAKQLLVGYGELSLAHVYVGDPAMYRSVSVEYEAAKREDDLARLAKTREDADVRARLCWTRASSVGRGLGALCKDIAADLLVVGSSRRRALGRVLFGDDARSALNHAPCAVAIAPAGYRKAPATLGQIGVGYDGSAESRQALYVAEGLAAEHASRVSVFEALETTRHGFPARVADGASPTSDLLAAAREDIAGLGEVEPYIAYGKPAEELARYSATVDLLVVGSRSYNPVRTLVHTTTAQKLAQTARCPLLVVTPVWAAVDAVNDR